MASPAGSGRANRSRCWQRSREKIPLPANYLPVHPFEAILGGTPEENARAFAALMNGAPGAYRDAVLLNAAAALVVAGVADDLRGGVEMARLSIDSGAARSKLHALAALTSAAG